MCTSRDLIKVRLKGNSLDFYVHCFKYVLKDVNYALLLGSTCTWYNRKLLKKSLKRVKINVLTETKGRLLFSPKEPTFSGIALSLYIL